MSATLVGADRLGGGDRAMAADHALERLPAGGGRVVSRQVAPHRHIGPHRVGDRTVLVVSHQSVDPGVADDVGQLGSRQAEVQRHEARPQASRGQHGLEEGGPIETEEADAIAMTDASRAQASRQSVDAVEELGVGARRPLEG